MGHTGMFQARATAAVKVLSRQRLCELQENVAGGTVKWSQGTW